MLYNHGVVPSLRRVENQSEPRDLVRANRHFSLRRGDHESVLAISGVRLSSGVSRSHCMNQQLILLSQQCLRASLVHPVVSTGSAVDSLTGHGANDDGLTRQTLRPPVFFFSQTKASSQTEGVICAGLRSPLVLLQYTVLTVRVPLTFHATEVWSDASPSHSIRGLQVARPAPHHCPLDQHLISSGY
jgi:hypothetical protein